MNNNEYNYVRPQWCKPNSERDIEMFFLLNEVYDISIYNKVSTSLLDVGFAGSGYIEKILELGTIKYTGFDGDSGRIQGYSLLMVEKPQAGFYSKEEWNNVLTKIDYIKSNITNYDVGRRYGIVMSISMIEHIVPLGYDYGNFFDESKDIEAVKSMKDLVFMGGYLLLTFPCGVERIFSPKEEFQDILKHTRFKDSFRHGRHDILIYDLNRINRIIGDWEVVKEYYWVDDDEGFGFKKYDKLIACGYEHKTSDVKSLCTLLLKKG